MRSRKWKSRSVTQQVGCSPGMWKLGTKLPSSKHLITSETPTRSQQRFRDPNLRTPLFSASSSSSLGRVGKLPLNSSSNTLPGEWPTVAAVAHSLHPGDVPPVSSLLQVYLLLQQHSSQTQGLLYLLGHTEGTLISSSSGSSSATCTAQPPV